MIRRLLLILLLAGSCFGANAFVQKCIATGASGSRSCTFGANTTTGNLIVMGIVVDDSSGTAITATQGSNTLTKSTNSPSATSTGHTWIYWKANITGGSNACNLTITSANTTSIWCREYSGLGNATLRIDAGATGTGTTVNTPSISCTAGDLGYAVAFEASSITNTGSPWAALDSPTQIQNGEADEYLLSAAGGSQAVNFATGSGAWSAMQACFAPVTTVGPNVGFKGKVGFIGKVGIN